MAKEKLSRFPLSKEALNDVFHRSSITKIGPEIPHTHLQWREIASSDTQPGRDLSAAHPRAPSAPDLGGEGAGLGGAGAGGRRVATPPARAPESRAACVSARTPPSRLTGGRTRRLAQGPEEAGPVRPRGRPPRAARGGRASAAAGARPRSRSGTQQREPPGRGCAVAAAAAARGS